MAVLTRDEILRRLSAGEIVIDPYSESQVGPASVDLHLASTFRVFRRVREIFHVTEEADYEAVSEVIDVAPGDYFVLMPGETCHGLTKERIALPDDLCGWLHGRSRFARLGLIVHMTAPLVQPGVNNHQALEMNNAGPMPLALRPGTAVCQIVLETCIGTAHYAGRYRDQESP
jgi:dCTP deaminase